MPQRSGYIGYPGNFPCKVFFKMVRPQVNLIYVFLYQADIFQDFILYSPVIDGMMVFIKGIIGGVM